MSGPNYLRKTIWLPTFQSDFDALPDNIKLSVLQALKDLCADPMPKRLRFHSLGGYANPKVYTIDVTENHAYKVSLAREGDSAFLRRVGTHKMIDRSP